MSFTIPKPGGGGDFKPAPEGTKPCVLVDVVDLGVVETKFGEKPMLRLVFQTPDTFEKDGVTLNYNVSSRYNKSLHEKASLTKAVVALLGRKIRASDYGVDGFDPETLIGKAALIQIVHSDPIGDEGKIYANIKGIMSLPDGMEPPAINENFTRAKDREERDEDMQAKRDKWAVGGDDAPPF